MILFGLISNITYIFSDLYKILHIVQVAGKASGHRTHIPAGAQRRSQCGENCSQRKRNYDRSGSCKEFLVHT